MRNDKADNRAQGWKAWRNPLRPRATVADEAALYAHHPSFTDHLPWVEYLETEQCFLLEDNRSVGAVFELLPLGTEGRELDWLMAARDALEDALQDSFDELDQSPWVAQFFCQDDHDFTSYLNRLTNYIRDSARGTVFTEAYLELSRRHLQAIAKPGGLFEDKVVTRLPWHGNNRRIRLVVYRWLESDAEGTGLTPVQSLQQTCERISAALQACGVHTVRVDGRGLYAWLLPWFNPAPELTDEAPEAFYQQVAYPASGDSESLALPFDHDFAERLFFNEPRSDVQRGLWYFDAQPHRVLVVDKLRRAPLIGQLTGETRKGDAVNALFDQLPEGTVMSLTLVVKPQDVLEEQLSRLARKAIGENLASTQTRQDVDEARTIIGRKHKLYRGTLAFYLRGHDEAQLHQRSVSLANALLGAGLQPVREGDEVGACNSYLRWLPMAYNPARDTRNWYTRLMFAQHLANLAPVWGRSTGTGHPGITLFNRGGSPLSFDPLSRLDRAMNGHLLLFGPTGAGKSATLVSLLMQVMAVYRPRLFIIEAGNSFGLQGDYFATQGLSVNKVQLKPGAAVSLAPFADAWRLVEQADQVASLSVDELDDETASHREDQRDILGELEITARLMITGGEAKEDARLSRADRSLIRECILDAAQTSVAAGRQVLTRDVRNALLGVAADPHLPEKRRERAQEMGESIDLFCQGFEGELFDRTGTSWPESDVTLVDLATYAREGYEAQLSISYISLMNTVNNLAERDQYLGRPIIMVTDEGHIITKNPLLAPFVVKGTKMWRKLGAWFWLATQNLADFPNAAQTMLNMIEWWICLNMPPAEIEEIARFKKLTPAQKALLLSASKEPGKYTEGVVLSKKLETLFRVVPPSLYLALAMTEPEEKAERWSLMQEHRCSELDAAYRVAARIDSARGIDPDPP
ncbi:conjugative transfer ATPase [Pseudomonas qingdaonensis]|uniref:Conjugative transfer ATPase n=1 Tax=Pseudomonas qingdaonensis TaxID=2056231 RepID=A0ABX8DP45_9PSED|nr:conjugative transfer ATPase [Pseudomonas qingdaonensis]QVL17244.1 conjugative transfer ATPase [Pseudomonas qingdaonensis]